MPSLSCVFIGSGQPLVECAEVWLARGQRIVGVVSDSHEVVAWCEQRGVTRIGTDEDLVWFLGREPFDHLFSVINHRLLSAEVLAIPRRASINYHDSLLPAYGGFNATAWSILDGNDRHGITWHRITQDADAGGVYRQVEIDVADDDTAFTLEAKCSEAAVASFAALADDLATGTAAERAQAGEGRSFHTMSDRPDAANLIDPGADAAAVARLVRALDYGPEDSPLGLAKLWDGAAPICVAAAVVGEATSAADGTVLAVADGELTVVVGGREVRFGGAADSSGRRLRVGDLAARGVVAGTVLRRPDAALRQRITDVDRVIRRHERWWVRRLAERRAPIVAQVHARGATVIRRERAVHIGASARAHLESLDRNGRLACWAAVLAVWVARLTDADTFDLDADLGTVQADLAPLFARTVPLRAELGAAGTFAELAERLGAQLATLAERRTFATDAVARSRALRSARDAGALDPGPVALVVDREPGDREHGDLGGAAVVLAVTGDGLGARLVHDAGTLDDADAGALADRFDVALGVLTAEPEAPLADVSLVSATERDRLLGEWNDTATPYRDDRCIHELFEEQVRRTPEQVALVFRDRRLTYRELNRAANVVARHLVQAGVQPDTRVGICIGRSPELVVGLLGILKAGGAYVPLDPVYPQERLAVMLEDAEAPVLLTQRHLTARLPDAAGQVLFVDDLLAAGDGHDDGHDEHDAGAGIGSAVRPEHLAYVIFTSGSTGRPKGVMIEHGNVSNFFTGMDGAVGADPGVLLAVTSISFDISVLELFWTLTRGFRVVLQEESDRASLGRRGSADGTRSRIGFGLFYFAADAADATGAYRLLVEGAKFADRNGFDAVWTPERHFHEFGGLYPSPAVTSAALATVTERIQIRAGSVVLPLHDPIRVAEEWAVVDNLSGGRVGLSFASGWHANDFALAPGQLRRPPGGDGAPASKRCAPCGAASSVRVRNGDGRRDRRAHAAPPGAARAADVDRLGWQHRHVPQRRHDGRQRAHQHARPEHRRAAREAGQRTGRRGLRPVIRRRGVATVMLHTFIGPDTEAVRGAGQGAVLQLPGDVVRPRQGRSVGVPGLRQADRGRRPRRRRSTRRRSRRRTSPP